MGIKKVTFSFDVPIQTLLTLVAEGHTEMGVHVYGDKPKLQALNGVMPKLLPPPAKTRAPNMQRIILGLLVNAENNMLATETLRKALAEHGFSDKSLSNQIYMLKQKRLIVAIGRGIYKLTPKGAVMEAAHG